MGRYQIDDNGNLIGEWEYFKERQRFRDGSEFIPFDYERWGYPSRWPDYIERKVWEPISQPPQRPN